MNVEVFDRATPEYHKLFPVGDWVAYDWARCILVGLECAFRRERDTLLVFAPCPNRSSRFVERSDTDAVEIARLMVHDYWVRDSQEFGGAFVRSGKNWREYINISEVGFAVLAVLEPDLAAECNEGPYTGGGGRWWHKWSMINQRLTDIGYFPQKWQGS